MDCHFCGRPNEGLPFRCNYCGEVFCGEHRLPENHACPRVGGQKQPGYARIPQPRETTRERAAGFFVRSGRSRFRVRYSGIFSEVETKHILLASSVMVLVGLSLVFTLVRASPLLALLFVPAFLISFLGHEIAHKILAQRNGLWAEFRTNMYGLLITAMSAILPFKFLAPGQVVIQGSGTRQTLGAVGLVGPGFNLVFGTGFFVLAKFVPGLLSYAFLGITMFNSWLAIFNLIPFGSFDGTNVFRWDRTRWAIAFVASCLLLILSFYPNLI